MHALPDGLGLGGATGGFPDKPPIPEVKFGKDTHQGLRRHPGSKGPIRSMAGGNSDVASPTYPTNPFVADQCT